MQPSPTQFKVDELARRAGMTIRNVRAHRTRGLLPPPEIRGRTAYYNEVHLERLTAIRRLQDEGLSLEEITRLIERMPAGTELELLALAHASEGSALPEEPVVVDTATVFAHWGGEATPELLERIEALGHVRALGDGLYEILSPRLYRSAAELARLGVPLEAVVGLAEQTWTHGEELADAYLALFAEHVAGPRWAALSSAERLEAVERLRPLGADSIAAIFELALTKAVTDGQDTARRGRRVKRQASPR